MGMSTTDETEITADAARNSTDGTNWAGRPVTIHVEDDGAWIIVADDDGAHWDRGWSGGLGAAREACGQGVGGA